MKTNAENGLFTRYYFSDCFFRKLQDDVNIIAVDWSKGAELDSISSYNTAVANTRVIGAVIGELIRNLARISGANFDNFCVVGHSLGAHVAGYVGEYIIQNGGATIGRITGEQFLELRFFQHILVSF